MSSSKNNQEATCTLPIEMDELSAICKHRNNPVIFIAASVLDMDALPTLFNVLSRMGHSSSLDVVLYGRGGEIASARRYAILLHKFCDQLNFIVPFHCQSTLTALVLAGNTIVAGDMALFSPIDPSLNCDGQGALASEDIRLFTQMGQQWFDIKSENSKTELLSALAGSVFPTTLTRLYRATLEVKEIASDLLQLGSRDMPQSQQEHIVTHLLQGYHSHNFAPTNEDLQRLGLPVERDSLTEALAWQLAQKIQSVHGGGARHSPQDSKNDYIIATESECWVRQVSPEAMAPVWRKKVE